LWLDKLLPYYGLLRMGRGSMGVDQNKGMKWWIVGGWSAAS